MAKEKSKELIGEIVDKMKAHELPYLEGSWERFSARHTSLVSNKQSNWKYWSAAAAVLFIASASILYLRQADIKQSPAVVNLHVEKNLNEAQPHSEATQIDVPALGIENTLIQPIVGASLDRTDQHDADIKKMDQSGIVPLDHSLQVVAQIFTDNSVKKEPVNLEFDSNKKNGEIKNDKVKSDNNNLANNNTVRKDQQGTSSVAEKLEKLGSLYASNSEKHDFASAIKKWEIGAFVAPSSTADKMSLGAGLSLAYQITDKISIRSGVSMQQYGAGADRYNNPGAVQSASMAYNDAVSNSSMLKQNESLLLSKQTVDKELSAVNNKLLTIDVPIDIRYHVSKSFYTSVGVSYVGVIDQTQENYFVNGINENTAANNGDAVYAPQNMKQSFKGNAVNTNDFNGFVNFSIGKKMTVGKKLSIAVEPFVKLPVGGLKTTDLNYTNGGLKIMTSF